MESGSDLTRRIRLYIPDRLIPADRKAREPLTRALLEDTPKPYMRSRRERFVRVDVPEDADALVVPRPIEQLNRTQRSQADELAAAAASNDVPLLVYGAADEEPIVPWPGAVLMHAGPLRGRLPDDRVIALPVFVGDMAQEIRDAPHEARVSNDDSRPTLGFCGHASHPLTPRALLLDARRLTEVAGYMSRRRTTYPAGFPSHLHLRHRVMAAFERSDRVHTQFVRRSRYRAADADPTTARRAFLENLADNEYALCIRGTGNFSARLYEALSAGRVPVLVDTGAMLPLEPEVDWSVHVVRIEPEGLHRAADRLAALHDELDPTARRHRAARNKEFWRTSLEENAFFGRLADRLRKTAS